MPYMPSQPPNPIYRDKCIGVNKIGIGSFNPQTGQLWGEYNGINMADSYPEGMADSPGDSPSDTPSIYSEFFVGNVSGAKPPSGICMPMKDTPLTSVDDYYGYPGLAYSYFLNMDDRPFFMKGDTLQGPDVYQESNLYKHTTFFVGGALGCPNMWDWYPPPPEFKRYTTYERTDFSRFKAESCYDFYILNHSIAPWFTMERVGNQTDDPLSKDDPDRSFLNNCQPFVSGNDALQLLKHKGDEKKMGYATVWQYRYRADYDEAEYNLSTYLQAAWNSSFMYDGMYKNINPQYMWYPRISLPCVLDQASPFVTNWPPFPQPKPITSDPAPPPKHTCAGDSVPESPPTADSPGDSCTPPYWPVPPDFIYWSPGSANPYYCPNVERITEPSHPYSPRNDYFMTDRDYSSYTSSYVYNKCLGVTLLGYSDYLERDHKPDEPEVACAIVPVDILSFRYQAFDNCITQRIAINFNAWIADGMPQPPHGWEDTGWIPPCKTKSWETDGPCECPTTMSIQQCCRIIVKDVVPANFLKYRTCEGLRHARYQKFNYWALKDDNFDAVSNTVGMGWGNYHLAVEQSADLNEIGCMGTEPYEYMFKNYFSAYSNQVDGGGKLIGYHMPYLRWYDTGVSATQYRHGGSFVNTLGSYDTLIGVGREERSKEDADTDLDGLKSAYNRAQENGYPMASRLRAPQMSEMGRVGGWAELKAHQMWTMRRNNLNCIGRYEKVFKPGGPEALPLAKAGAGYTSKAGVQWPWSLAWRGYLTDTHGSDFPVAFGGGGGAIGMNLDYALPGDIIVYYGIGGLPHMAYVTDIGFDVVDKGQAYFDYSIGQFRLGGPGGEPLTPSRLYIVDWDQGKFLTSTGSTMKWGQGPERTLYKNMAPYSYRQEICSHTFRALTDYTDKDQPYGDGSCRFYVADESLDAGTCMQRKCQPSCEDSDYSACVLPDGIAGWWYAEIYRPYYDVQQCNEATASGAPPSFSFDMGATYNWPGPMYDNNGQIIGASLDPSVVYQSLSSYIDTNQWAGCVADGRDPPSHWAKDYKGPQTGALTDTTLCGPKWHYTTGIDESVTGPSWLVQEREEGKKSGCSGVVKSGDPNKDKHSFFPWN